MISQKIQASSERMLQTEVLSVHWTKQPLHIRCPRTPRPSSLRAMISQKLQASSERMPWPNTVLILLCRRIRLCAHDAAIRGVTPSVHSRCQVHLVVTFRAPVLYVHGRV